MTEEQIRHALFRLANWDEKNGIELEGFEFFSDELEPYRIEVFFLSPRVKLFHYNGYEGRSNDPWSSSVTDQQKERICDIAKRVHEGILTKEQVLQRQEKKTKKILGPTPDLLARLWAAGFKTK